MAKNDTVSDFKSSTDYTADKAKNTADYAADRAKSGIDDARSGIKDAANRASNMADNAINSADRTYHEVKDVAEKKMGEVETMIRDKPVQATLVAAGIGFLVGALLTR